MNIFLLENGKSLIVLVLAFATAATLSYLRHLKLQKRGPK
jgi:hypothetical protein